MTRLHCAPTETSAQALRNEGVPAANIKVTGNTVIHSLLHTVQKERADDDTLAAKTSAGDEQLRGADYRASP